MKHLKRFNEEAEFYPGFEKDEDYSNNPEITVSFKIPKSMISIARKNGVSEENMEDLFVTYISHKIGETYGQEGDEFSAWCEESDNIVDFIEYDDDDWDDVTFEGKTDKAYKSKDSDVKKESFREKIENFLKSKGCKLKQVGDDFEVHVDDEHVCQIMFRNDKMTVKKKGNKFGKDFEYNQLGDVKKELTKILNF
jgi:hypothetical protein